MTERDNIAQPPAESDKQTEVKKPTEKSQVDVLDLMEESAEQAKALSEDYADGKLRFTVGDGGFGIDYKDKEAKSEQSRLPEAAGLGRAFTPTEPFEQALKVTPKPGSIERVGDQVTKVKYPNGTTVEFEYGPDGKVSKLNFPDSGDRWEKQDGSWKHLDNATNKPIPPKPGDELLSTMKDVEVTPNGDIITTRRDGSTLRENYDLSTVETEVNKAGEVVKVTKTDSDGQEKIYQKKDMQGWTRVDANGNDMPPARMTPGGTRVDTAGDGSVMLTAPDGKQRKVDAQGRVFEDGKEVQNSGIVKRDDGTIEVTNSDNTKTEISPPDSRGERQVVTHDGNYPKPTFTISGADGTLDVNEPDRRILKYHNGGEYEVHDNGVMISRSPDGRTQVEPAPWRTQTQWSETGRPEHSDYTNDPPGTIYHKDSQGRLLSTFPDGSYRQIGGGHTYRYDPKTGTISDEKTTN